MPELSNVNSISNSEWTVTFSIQPNTLLQSDSQLIAKFGEPTINTGGTFETAGLAFTLPSNYIRVVSDLPFAQTFDTTSAPFNQGFANTKLQANAFITAFITAYTAAFTALRANVDTWSGNSLTTI